MAAAPSSTSERVCEGLEFLESNNILLMALMEETPQEEDQYCEEDDRLMSMIQSLEAEISSTTGSADPYQSCDDDMEVGVQVDDQDFSTSTSVSFCTDWDDDMQVVSASSSSSSSFDEEMVNAWSLCAADGDDIISGADYYYSSESYFVVDLLENYLPQETSDLVF